jgi:hypothetical protein
MTLKYRSIATRSWRLLALYAPYTERSTSSLAFLAAPYGETGTCGARSTTGMNFGSKLPYVAHEEL